MVVVLYVPIIPVCVGISLVLLVLLILLFVTGLRLVQVKATLASVDLSLY